MEILVKLFDDSKKIGLTEMDFYSHSDADGDLINYEPNFICGFSPRGFEASQLLDANHREWKDFIHGRRNHWERKQIESYINVINESMGMWTEKGETTIIFGFKSAISVIKYSLFFRDPNTRPTGWVLYGTNNKNLIPNGRASAKKGFHAQKKSRTPFICLYKL